MNATRGSSRLVVDGTKCDRHGMCALRCPDRIALDEWGFASIDPEPIADRRVLARARRAVRACPAEALELVATALGSA
ncbi:MAG: ferredoxin [Acidimicrobiales bacterium]